MSADRQKVASVPSQRSKDQFLELYRQMVLIRRFEERAAEAYTQGKIGGFLHLAIGEEPANVGVMAALRSDDDVFTHYRSHGQALARGMDPKAVMAELFGRATGVSKGRGGSMHLASLEHHFWGGYAIVGGHIPMAVGMAVAHQYTGSDRVVVCIFGDGAVNTGAFHEALNMAGVWRLPIVFVVSNNLYGMGTAINRSSAVTEVYKRAAAYNMPGVRANGNDVLETEATVREAVEKARAGEGPSLVELMTYRFRGHSMADPELYRSKEEVEQWKARDPIAAFRRRLEEEGIATAAEFEAIDRRVAETVDEAVRFANESPEPDPATLFDHVYVNP
ncbi:MAG: pyruvate dehydrogenase (acetyl-transferring) E1 component subunit alpha [Firmicutes bacterium]|nr:pyruvate dehydrogenase (acetyl-transferring) E1 component subunit alpha [Bacillota bacterium]